MHAEILSAVFPPPYPHGQFMHHKGSHNQQMDQLRPPLHAVHKEFSSYQPTFGIGHFDGARSMVSVPIQYPDKHTVTANIIAAVHQPLTRHENFAHEPSNDRYQLPNSSNPLAHTEHGQPPFGAGHTDTNRLQTSVPIVVPETQSFPEIIVLEHGSTEPYEHAASNPSNHHHNRLDSEEVPVDSTTTASFNHYQHLNRSRSHSPVVVPENEIIVLEHGGPGSYEHAGNYPSSHHRQRSDGEKIPVETDAIHFDQYQHLDRSRSQTPKQVVAPENEIIVLEHNVADPHHHAGHYPSDHRRHPSDYEKIPVETIVISFDQHQQLDRSRSHTPIQAIASDAYPERRGVVPLRQEEPGFYGQGADLALRDHQCPNPANPPPQQPQVGVNNRPTPPRDETPPQNLALIISEPVFYPPPTPGFRVISEPTPDFYLIQHEAMTDEEAAASVYNHFSQRNGNPQQVKAEQELSRLILSSPFMTGCLGEVVHWANILFFEEKLTVAKVDLQWSDPSDPRFDPSSGGLIGTTELKPDHRGGFQTRITLSQQRLMSGTYDQRLVLSAILHECVHAYLFICRGPEATEDGGHTKGFRDIARLIDSWVDGDGSFLRLYCEEADLESFRTNAGHGWNCNKGAWGLDNGFLWTSSLL